VLIDPALQQSLYAEIENRLVEQGCEVKAINGQPDHIHFLFHQNPLLPLHDIMRFVQGMSQRWYQVHDTKTGWYKFRWDDGYCLYSVSESSIDKAQFFIEKQDEIHQSLNFWEERQQLNQLHKVDLSDEALELELKTWQNRFSIKNSP
jgi:putative transposase